MAYENKIEKINQKLQNETNNEIIGLLNKILITYKDLQRNPRRYKGHESQVLKPLSSIESQINKIKQQSSGEIKTIMIESNIKKIKIIHIPKTGGQYLGKVLGIHPQQINIFGNFKYGGNVNDNTKIIFVKRNPFNWYGSLYNFLRNSPQQVSNTMRKSAKNLFFEEFFYAILNKDNKKVIFQSLYDKSFLLDKNNWGLLTYYVKYFCSGNGNDTILKIFKWIKSRCDMFEIETLSKDLLIFCKENNTSYNEKLINEKINSVPNEDEYENWYTEEMKELVYKKDKLYFENFYPDDIGFQNYKKK